MVYLYEIMNWKEPLTRINEADYNIFLILGGIPWNFHCFFAHKTHEIPRMSSVQLSL